MNRRDAIRNLSLLGVGLILPIGKLIPAPSKKPFHFIGLGGAGSVLAEHFFNMGLPGRHTCIDKDRKPELTPEIGFVRFQSPIPAKEILGIRFYEVSDLEKHRDIPLEVQSLVGGDEFFVVLSGLGGFTGSYLSMQLSGMLHRYNKDHLLMGTSPFSFEGKHVNDIAIYTRNMIAQHSKLLVYNLAKTGREHGNIALQEAFRYATNDSIYNMFIRQFPWFIASSTC